MNSQRNTRQDWLKAARRLVIKIGSSVLTSPKGDLNLSHIESMADDITNILRAGRQVIIVSSGAIAAGVKKVGLPRRPASIPEKQAAAAVGQARLMWVYERSFEKNGILVAQILLTRDDLAHRRRFLNARNTLQTLIKWGILPIINENDSVVIDEIKFGDNDALSALVTNVAQADLLIMLSDIEGLFDFDPKIYRDAKFIPTIEDVDCISLSNLETSCSETGTGGMVSKLQAAKTAAVYGVPTIIANGKRPNILTEILSGKEVGTFVYPKQERINSWKHWIAYSRTPSGALILDDGARKVITENGKSLLPSGIVDVVGEFGAGDSVSCKGLDGVEFARGLVNYSSAEIRRIKGRRTSEIEGILGYKYYDEIIHRDDLVLMV